MVVACNIVVFNRQADVVDLCYLRASVLAARGELICSPADCSVAASSLLYLLPRKLIKCWHNEKLISWGATLHLYKYRRLALVLLSGSSTAGWVCLLLISCRTFFPERRTYNPLFASKRSCPVGQTKYGSRTACNHLHTFVSTYRQAHTSNSKLAY